MNVQQAHSVTFELDYRPQYRRVCHIAWHALGSMLTLRPVTVIHAYCVVERLYTTRICMTGQARTFS